MTGTRGPAGLASGEPQQGVHLRVIVPLRVTNPVCQEVRRITDDVCRLPGAKRGHHQRPIPAAPNRGNTDEAGLFFWCFLLSFAVQLKSDGVLSEWENPESIYNLLPSR